VALGIGEVTLFHDLQQQVERLRMRLLDLVKDDDGVGAAADRFRQLAGIFIANVAGRRTDEPGHVVPLHELRHVELHQRLFAAEEEASQRLR
jgi:hypothetical protein